MAQECGRHVVSHTLHDRHRLGWGHAGTALLGAGLGVWSILMPNYDKLFGKMCNILVYLHVLGNWKITLFEVSKLIGVPMRSRSFTMVFSGVPQMQGASIFALRASVFALSHHGSQHLGELASSPW